jgi:hypothetical protein
MNLYVPMVYAEANLRAHDRPGGKHRSVLEVFVIPSNSYVPRHTRAGTDTGDDDKRFGIFMEISIKLNQGFL